MTRTDKFFAALEEGEWKDELEESLSYKEDENNIDEHSDDSEESYSPFRFN